MKKYILTTNCETIASLEVRGKLNDKRIAMIQDWIRDISKIFVAKSNIVNACWIESDTYGVTFKTTLDSQFKEVLIVTILKKSDIILCVNALEKTE